MEVEVVGSTRLEVKSLGSCIHRKQDEDWQYGKSPQMTTSLTSHPIFFISFCLKFIPPLCFSLSLVYLGLTRQPNPSRDTQSKNLPAKKNQNKK